MILLIILSILFLYLFDNFYWKRRHLPPGPVPLPLFGNVLSFNGVDTPIKLIEWRKKYGNVYTYWLGELPIVAVNDMDTINDKFVKDGDTFAGRPLSNQDMMELNKNGRTGVIFTDGEVWRELRRFSLQTLRDFGVGKNVMQEKILHEVVLMIDAIREDAASVKTGGVGGQEVQSHIDIAVGSIIMQLIFGYRYSSNHESKQEFFKYKSLLNQMMKDWGSFAGLLFFKTAHRYKHVPYIGSFYKRMAAIKIQFWAMFDLNIENRRRQVDFDSHQEPTDYIEAFLRKQHELQVKGLVSKAFTHEHLTGALWDMWVAGQETTSNTIGWACVFLINNFDVQQKVQAELDTVIGSDRLVTSEDKPALHYLNAAVCEVQRLSNLVPHNVQHRVLKDVEIGGYRIPKDTVVLDQVSVVLYDEELFPEPLKFKPERHLDEKGVFRAHPAVIPFGVGKRSCLGESLARMEVFLFVANMFNQLVLTSDEPIVEIRQVAATVPPPKFKCHVQNRKMHH